MIAQQTSRDGEFFSSSSQTSNMNMAVTAEAFKVMSSQIYQHKGAAVVREYMCNACDAHIDSGKAHVPYDVHAPTHLDPTFRVRDYGTGLDDHGVRVVFSTYFQSTKKEKKEAVGFLGLGSKSGYSYSDSFLINAFHDGTLRSYMAFFDQNNMPALNLMGEWPTEEHNGVEISMTVKPADIDTFRDDIAFISSFMKVKPNVINGCIWNVDIAESLEKNGWVTVGDNIPHHTTSLYQIRYDGVGIVMGGVVYPISTSQAISLLDNAQHENFIHSMRTKLFVSVPMGSVEFAASRETLSFTESTKEVVKEYLSKAIDGILSSIKAETAKMDHVVLASRYVRETLGILPTKMEWKDGKPLSVVRRGLGKFLRRNEIGYMRKTRGTVVTRVYGGQDLEDFYGHTKIIVKDCSRTGEVKYGREYLIDKNIDDYVLVMKKSISNRKLQRLQHIFGIADDDIIYTSDIIPVKKSVSKKLSSSTEIRGVWRDVSEPEFRNSSPMETEGYRVAFVDMDMRDRDRDIMFQYDENSPTTRISLQGMYSADMLRRVGIERIIVRNKQNSKRIERLGAKNIHCVIRDFLTENKQELWEIERNERIRSNTDLAIQEMTRMLVEEGSEAIKGISDVDKYVSMVDNMMAFFSSPVMRNLSGLIKFDERVEEIAFIDMMEDMIIETVNEKYPLLRQGERFNHDDIDYIHAMDLYREAKLINQM